MSEATNETYTSYQTGTRTRIEPYDLDDHGNALSSGQRCKVTIGDAKPIILDRAQMQRWIDHMDEWSKQ